MEERSFDGMKWIKSERIFKDKFEKGKSSDSKQRRWDIIEWEIKRNLLLSLMTL